MKEEVIAQNDQLQVLHWPEFTLDGTYFPPCWQITHADTGWSENYPTERLAMKRFRHLTRTKNPAVKHGESHAATDPLNHDLSHK